MTQNSFVNRKESSWKDFEEMIKKGKKHLKSKASYFPAAYRELTQDLNTAKANGYSSVLIERLNFLVLEGNQILYSKRSWSFNKVLDFFLITFPSAVRSQWRSLGVSLFIFYGLIIFFTMLCVRNPLMVNQIIGHSTARQLEQMYNPENDYYLTPRDISTDADMFGFYVFNNISIAFRTFAGGILAGIGSILILAFNGVYLGVATAHIINSGYGNTFFPFVIGHGSFELTAIVLSAQGGLILGFSLFFTRGRSRQTSLKIAGETALPLIAGAAVMLLLAAGIEAFWSSRHELPLYLRYGAGAVSWLLVILYFCLAGRGKKVNE